MTKITGAGKTASSRSIKSASKTPKAAAGSFNIGAVNTASGNGAGGGVAPIAQVEALNALIALQTEGGGKSKTIAAAQRALNLLDRIRDGLLAGRVQVSDLEALALAADVKAQEIDAEDGALASIYHDIKLRARVELAKLGR